jgi:preprotein translocase subunit SecG
MIVCLFLIGVVLLQQGRSADLAGAFGGQGSQTAFGPRAAANVLTRLTTWSAVIFMVTSISLTVLYYRTTSAHSVLSGTKSAPVSAPAKSIRIRDPQNHPAKRRILLGRELRPDLPHPQAPGR